MTEQEIAELVQALREAAAERSRRLTVRAAINGELDKIRGTTVDLVECRAADLIEAQQAALALCERRAEEAESRNVFLLTELERILKEAK